ncbi:MAG: nicotinate-nucleotide diphosphorylase (carboxylating) [Zetaproteobacteria bacterium CG2_30_59_37]|nr:MAG: nicotinate-nucleotide diphosphorylase (carboxylating) [Zetaproteobacteria bacterium CG2_30_59_37]
MTLHENQTDDLIRRALAEDVAGCDLTAKATIAGGQQGSANITAKAAGVLSGIALADRVFALLDDTVIRQWHLGDGDAAQPGDRIATLSGPLRSLLSAERTALNFIQHLSGIASATREFVQAVAGTGCAVVDTRKTTPGLRYLEKQAVLHGGGLNHRMDLASGMLIKENHIAGAGSIAAAVSRCRALAQAEGCGSDVWVEVECENMDEVLQAVAAAPDIILLDNMTPDETREARKLVPDSIVLESSGNITLSNARDYAVTGVNRIAIGAITHSTSALDISMRVGAAPDGV